jgi:hypothetical protein
MMKKYEDKLELAALNKAVKDIDKKDMSKEYKKPESMCKCPECGYEATEETFKQEESDDSGEGEALE